MKVKLKLKIRMEKQKHYIYSKIQKQKIMKTKLFTDENLNFHRVDTQGNYFINNKCVNPKATIEGHEIGYNIPTLDWTEHKTNIAENIWIDK